MPGVCSGDTLVRPSWCTRPRAARRCCSRSCCLRFSEPWERLGTCERPICGPFRAMAPRWNISEPSCLPQSVTIGFDRTLSQRPGEKHLEPFHGNPVGNRYWAWLKIARRQSAHQVSLNADAGMHHRFWDRFHRLFLLCTKVQLSSGAAPKSAAQTLAVAPRASEGFPARGGWLAYFAGWAVSLGGWFCEAAEKASDIQRPHRSE